MIVLIAFLFGVATHAWGYTLYEAVTRALRRRGVFPSNYRDTCERDCEIRRA